MTNNQNITHTKVVNIWNFIQEKENHFNVQLYDYPLFSNNITRYHMQGHGNNDNTKKGLQHNESS